MVKPLSVPNLTVAGCRARQQRLRQALAERNLDAALIADRRHVYYFTGYWRRCIYAPCLLISRDGPTILSAPLEPTTAAAADETIVYSSHHLGTLVDDQSAAARDPLRAYISNALQIGSDIFNPLSSAHDGARVDLRPLIWSLRRRKDPDEVELIRCAIAATEAAYGYAFDALQPGLTETKLFAGILATAAEAVGEPLGEIGNDFQIGSPGGLPRRRPAQAGEVAVLDLSIVVRGYTSDLCRSFVVGRQPSELQLAAHQRIADVFNEVEAAIRPGVEARDLFAMAAAKLDGYCGWKFGHHLGHGIGLSPHEAPRLNPHWSDRLEVGDVFTVEPGLYAEELRSGLRIEQNYFLSDNGLERLSHFPISLA